MCVYVYAHMYNYQLYRCKYRKETEKLEVKIAIINRKIYNTDMSAHFTSPELF